MEPPELHSDDNKTWYFFVEPKDTGNLIDFLRKHFEGISVDVGGIVVNSSKDTDVFNVTQDVSREAISGALAKFYGDRST